MAAKKTAKTGKPATKSEIMSYLSKKTGLTKKEVNSVFEALQPMIKRELKSKGVFSLPGMLKIKRIRKPATKARKGINPFTGEETIFKAKPARNVVKVQALKGLKDMVK